MPLRAPTLRSAPDCSRANGAGRLPAANRSRDYGEGDTGSAGSLTVDNRNLRAEQHNALGEAIDLIDEALALLVEGKSREADNKIHDARRKINSVLAGDRSGEPGPAV
jgi:hypothetical protein